MLLNTELLRVYVEMRQVLDCDAIFAADEFRGFLGISGVGKVRILRRYDVHGLTEEEFVSCVPPALMDFPTDVCYFGELPFNKDDFIFAVKYLDGVYDQRADSAAFLIQCKTGECKVDVARVYIVSGDLTEGDKARIKHYVINPVDEMEVGA
jgi:phosphoribosylformylglycinamidine synthase